MFVQLSVEGFGWLCFIVGLCVGLTIGVFTGFLAGKNDRL